MRLVLELCAAVAEALVRGGTDRAGHLLRPGGVSEGIRQGGGSSHGQDLHLQPAYVARFGGSTFTQGDSTGLTGVADLRKRSRAFFTMASPPCKPYSGARMRGAPKEEPMISQTRDVLRQAGGLYAI